MYIYNKHNYMNAAFTIYLRKWRIICSCCLRVSPLFFLCLFFSRLIFFSLPLLVLFVCLSPPACSAEGDALTAAGAAAATATAAAAAAAAAAFAAFGGVTWVWFYQQANRLKRHHVV